MSRKTLEDFENSDGSYDYQAYADYLESAECADDEGYDIYADVDGNIYERTDGICTIVHGHNNVNDPRDPREPNDPKSYGRKWKNPWLKYVEKLNLTQEEIELLNSLCTFDGINVDKNLSADESKLILKRK